MPILAEILLSAFTFQNQTGITLFGFHHLIECKDFTLNAYFA